MLITPTRHGPSPAGVSGARLGAAMWRGSGQVMVDRARCRVFPEGCDRRSAAAECRRALKTGARWFISAVMDFVKPPEPPAGTLIHVSDLHLCRPDTAPWSAFRNKRLLS